MVRMQTITASLLLIAVASSLAVADTGVTGRVVRLDKSGIPLGMAADARVEIKDQGGRQVADVNADANGLIKLKLPRAGRYFYAVNGRDEGRGFEHTLSDGYAVYSFFIIDHDKPATAPSFQQVGTLRGRVVERTADGDVGIPQAAITLRQVGTRHLTRIVTQVNNEGQHAGEYDVILEVGTYLASVSAGGFEQLVDPTPIEIVADASAKRDFVLRRHELPPEVQRQQGIRGLVAVQKNGSAVPPPFPVRIDILKALGNDVVHTTAPGDSRGTFSQATVPGMYRVVAVAPDNGFRKAVSPPVFVFPGRYTHVKLILRPEKPDVEPTPTEFAIEVHVIDREQEQPLADALVRLRQKTQPISEALRARTGADGVATFSSDVPGGYLTLAEAKGYKSAGLGFLAGPEEPNRVRIALDRSTTPTPSSPYILVTVRDAENKQPLPSAAVLVHRDDLSIRDGVRRTADDNGQAKIHVKPGNFVVLGGASGYRAARTTVRVSRAEENRVELVLTRGTRPTPGSIAVTGKVVYEPPPGLAGYALISGAAMQWKRTAPVPGLARTVTTNEIGQYRIDLREGTYTVNIKPPNENFLPFTATVGVRQGMGAKDFKLKARTSPPPGALVDVAGFVLAGDRGRPRAVPDSVVEWRRADGGPPVVQTDSASRMGRYGVRIPAGAYEVTIKPPKPFQIMKKKVRVYAGMRSQNFTLTSSEDGGTPPVQLINVTGITVGTRPPGRSRIPVANAEVVWIRPGQIAKSTSGKDGRFQLRLARGDYRVVAKAKGYEDLDTKITVSREMSMVSLNFKAAGEPVRPSRLTVDVRVVEQKLLLNRRRITTPLADAQILIRQRTRVVASGKTNRDGHYAATLPPGTYDVKVTRRDYVPQTAAVSLSTSNVKRDVVMRRAQVTPPPATKKQFTLRVVAPSAVTRPGIRPIPRGVAQADITVIKGSTRVASGKTDRAGTYRVSLEPGTYAVKVSGALIRPAGTTVTIASSNVTRQITVQRTTTERPLIRPPTRPRPKLKIRPN